MAYYDALVAAWNSATQPPPGVTGQALQAGDTTATKVGKVNGWSVANQQKALVPPSDVLNCILPADLNALTANQLTIINIYMQGTSIDVSSGSNIRAAFQTLFAGKTTTLQNFQNLVAPFDSAAFTWCQAHGYPFVSVTLGNLSVSDANNAGLV